MLGLDTVFRDEEERKFPAMLPDTQQGYDPVSIATFQKAFEHLPIRFDEFSFIDLGSGKGRALLLAAEYPFRQTIGVEYSPHYHAIACRNVETYQKNSDKAISIELINGDATAFEIPTGKNVFFLFNPFQGLTFSQVVRNLEKAVNSEADEIYVVYVNPVCRVELDSSPAFRILHDEKDRDCYSAFTIYQAAH